MDTLKLMIYKNLLNISLKVKLIQNGENTWSPIMKIDVDENIGFPFSFTINDALRLIF